MFIEIPTYDSDTDVWSTTDFATREDFVKYLWTLWKKPGEYEFDETSLCFNTEARKFNKTRVYCAAPYRTKDYNNYWDAEKNKCRKGVIFKNGRNQWYLSRYYYMWLNFLPIYNKEIADFGFPDVRDAQYHIALYEELARYSHKHVAILKKRQIASSYFHGGVLINNYWFEAGSVNKMAGSLKDYINEKGTWRFLEEYRNFLNEHTAWYRPSNPDKVLDWQQKIEITVDGRKKDIGLKSVIIGLTLDKNPTSGVGGPTTFFFYEEGGMASKANETAEFLLPSLKSGMVTTGLFAIAGSVGDLEQCEPLKEMILFPDSKDILAVETNLLNEHGETAMCGLFIPEQWSMLPCIDEYGNSQVERALEMIIEERIKWKKDLSSSDYQLRISQKPINIEEAFASRKDSIFAQHLVNAQIKRIEEKQYFTEYVDLSRDETGKIAAKESKKLPITEFPLSPKSVDKEGVIVVFERPCENPSFGMYYASLDPVSEGKAECVDNMIYTHFGRKRIGDVEIGDLITSSSGSITTVTGVFPQGIKKLYRVYFSDGHSILVCDEHLWNVKLNGGSRSFVTLSTKDLMDKDKKISYRGTGRNKEKTYTINTFIKDNNGRNKWSIPIIKNPISFCTYRADEIKIDPYFLGLLIGDGGLSQRAIRFSSIDKEIIDYIESILPKNMSVKSIKGSNCDYRISINSGNRNPITDILKNLMLQGKKSEHKFIPKAYKYSNVEDRIALLQGLMDTDGSCTNHGSEFYSSSKILAYDVVELVQSLGGIAKIRMKKTTHLDSYIVRVLLPPEICPFKLSRKKSKYIPSKVFSRYITDIKYEKEGDAVCISVDANDQLYVTEHAIVTHNTTTSASLCSIIIYKAPIEKIIKKSDGSVESHIEKGGVVASWCGRFDDLNKTHERLEILIEWYNAWTVIENNVSLFIGHMIAKRKQRYLVPKSQIMFLKDLEANTNVFQEYGWRNIGLLFKNNMLPYATSFVTEEIDVETKANGDIVRITYGVERIPDIMILKEMKAYREGLNVDRLVAFTALVAFIKIQFNNRGYTKKVEHEDKNLDKSHKNSNLKLSPFRHMGNNTGPTQGKNNRNPFKNIR